MTWTRVATVILLLGTGTVACDRDDPAAYSASRANPVVPLDTGWVEITSGAERARLRVEIAETEEQTRIGLMDRDSIGPDEGMVFLFAEVRPPESGFWMFRTRVPLDIAYVDDGGRIVAIREMVPCSSPVSDFCPLYAAGAEYSAALETSRGYFAREGLGVGDSVAILRSSAD